MVVFNKTEMLQIRWGRNDRWQDRAGAGFTSGSRGKVILQIRQDKGVKGGRLISKSSRKAAMKAAKVLSI
jgi:hypothetical protein